MLADLDKTPWNGGDNFDASLKEPVGHSVQASQHAYQRVGGHRLWEWPQHAPHNLSEVSDAIVYLVDNPQRRRPWTSCQFVKGPDFPTGGTIYGSTASWKRYQTGRGKIKVRAKTHFEDVEHRKRIIVDENHTRSTSPSLWRASPSWSKIRRSKASPTFGTNRTAMACAIVIDLRKDVMEEIILNQLYKHTRWRSPSALSTWHWWTTSPGC